MSTDKNIKIFTASDIEKYHKGLLSPQERHAIEKAALDDPLLADAMEGYYITPVSADADRAELRNRLAERLGNETKISHIKSSADTRSFSYWKAAAAIVIIAGAGLLTYQFAFNKKETSIAKADTATTEKSQVESTPPQQPVTDSSQSNIEESIASKEQVENKTSLNDVPSTKSSLHKTDTNLSYNNVTTEVAAAPTFGFADTLKNNRNNAESDLAKKEARSKAEEKQLNEVVVAAQSKKDAQGISRNAPAAKNRADNTYETRANHFRGRVTDASNNGVPFANVTNTDDNVGTYTDARGYFNLTSPDTMLQVQVRGLGYNENNISLRNNVSNNQVVLQEDKNIAAHTISSKKVNTEKYARGANMKIENMPEPEDGWDNYDTYLSNNLKMPDEVKAKQMDNGRVEVSFEVNKYGEPVNMKVEKSLCSTCDKEALRLIKDGPKWKRKSKKGRTTVTVTF